VPKYQSELWVLFSSGSFSPLVSPASYRFGNWTGNRNFHVGIGTRTGLFLWAFV